MSNKRQKTFNKEFADAAYNGDVKTVKAMLEKRQVNVNDTCALYKASKAGHLSVVQNLIKAGADVNVSHSKRGRAALLAACKYGLSLEVVVELLKAGAKVDTRDSRGESALLLLLESISITSERKLAIARLLLEAKCDVNIRVGDTSALFLACENDIPDEILTLIVASGTDLAATTNCGMNALHLCIDRKSSIDKIRVLLQKGINVNGKNEDGKTPLLTALEASGADSLSIVQELIKAGADVNMTHSKRGTYTTPLQAACMNGHSIEAIQELLKAGAKVDLRDSHGKSALLLVLDSAHTDSERKVAIARLLLEANCDVNVRVRDTNALFLACENDIPDDIFSTIVASGADLAATTNCGLNALHLCICNRSSLEKIRVLLKYGVNVNGRTNRGKTPLLQAVEVGDTELISLLLHNNASILARANTALMEVLGTTGEDQIINVRLMLSKMNATDRCLLDLQNDKGWTALHFAAKCASKKAIHELLNWKPDITRKTDDYGRTALHILIKNEYRIEDDMFDVLRCLVEHENGYRTHAINLQDYKGCTALHLALENDCSDSLLQYLSNATNVSIPNRKGETSLHTAVLKGRSEAVILALLGSRHGAEAANIQDSMGRTALHWVIFRNKDDDEKVVRALSRVTNVNAQDHQGKTALHYAVERIKIAFVNILLYEQKKNLCLQDYQGNTPLSLACKPRRRKVRCQLSVIFQLYQYGVAYGENMV